jgi:GH18 family chitinase
VAFFSIATTALSAERPRVVAYVPTWVDLKAYADTIPYDKVTHLNIAFANPKTDDGDLSFDPRCDAVIAKAHANGVKVLISIGGGAAADNKVLKPRYFRLIAPDQRAAFVAKLLAYLTEHDFDGLDVDIEGPSINADYAGFIADCSAALKPKGKLLTSALSVGYGGKNVKDETLAYFDFVNIMAYDATGTWAPNRPGQHSSMELAKESIAYWQKHGLTKDQTVLGVPFYGYSFGNNPRKGNVSYGWIVNQFPGAERTDEIGDKIFYNGIPTIRAKTRFVLDEGLGGVMIWSLDNDVPGERSLLATIDAEIKAAAKPLPKP